MEVDAAARLVRVMVRVRVSGRVCHRYRYRHFQGLSPPDQYAFHVLFVRYFHDCVSIVFTIYICIYVYQKDISVCRSARAD
jgi:hypothetical protein